MCGRRYASFGFTSGSKYGETSGLMYSRGIQVTFPVTATTIYSGAVEFECSTLSICTTTGFSTTGFAAYIVNGGLGATATGNLDYIVYGSWS